MIQTWMADVTSLMDEKKYQYYYEQVPQHRKDKADRLRFQSDRALSIGAWILYEKMKQEYHLDEEAVFNLSHSGDFALCSVDDSGKGAKVGCDVEQIKAPHFDLAKRYFCESEHTLIRENEDYFYRFWVLKESFMKATRLGMKLPMDAFEIQFENGQPILVRQPEEIGGTYFLKEYKVKGIPYRIAVCGDEQNFAEEIRVVKL